MDLLYLIVDLVADAYNPILLLCVVLYGFRAVPTDTDKLTGVACRRVACRSAQMWDLCVLLILIYGMRLLDDLLRIWPRWGLDYSTHTAFAAAMCVALWQYSPTKLRVLKPWLLPLSLLMYLSLMHYKQYHTWGDMVTTLLYIGSAIAAVKQMSSNFLKKV